MRSKQLALDSYDAGTARSGYLDYYDQVLEPWVNREIRLLEIGINTGGSMQLWRDYFPKGVIAGIDIRLPSNRDFGERIHLFEGHQADRTFLTEVCRKVAPDGFDIIIDDASHVGELARITFWHLFDLHLKPGGLYSIEDWGTGYWDAWVDGKDYREEPRDLTMPAAIGKRPLRSHSYGMVGFVKELIDEQGMSDATKRGPYDQPERSSKFESMLIVPGIVFVRKARRAGAGVKCRSTDVCFGTRICADSH